MSVLDLILLDKLIIWRKDYPNYHKEIMKRIEQEKNAIVRYKLRNLYYKHIR